MNNQYSLHPEPNDETLIAQVVQRDVEAFALLYDRYSPAVYSMAVHMVGSSDAEDLVQEVFLRLWHRAAQFDETRGLFRPWFMTIARHCMLDELRRRSQQQRLEVAESVEQVLLSAIDPTINVERVVRQREAGAAVLAVLQTLPAEQRRVLVLAYFGGLSQTAIAKTLGWPLGTVKKRIRLGMQKLRGALTADWSIEEASQGPASSDKNRL